MAEHVVPDDLLTLLREVDTPTVYLAIDDIERSDEGSVWRRYQKNQLDSSYSKLWDSFDAYIHIKGPGFGTVFDWRKQQEASNLKVDEDDLPKESIFCLFGLAPTESIWGQYRTGVKPCRSPNHL